MNQYGSFKLGITWRILLGVVVPIVLGALLITDVQSKISEGYGGFDSWAVAIFGWGAIGFVIVFAVVMTLIPWSSASALYTQPEFDDAQQPSDAVHKRAGSVSGHVSGQAEPDAESHVPGSRR